MYLYALSKGYGYESLSHKSHQRKQDFNNNLLLLFHCHSPTETQSLRLGLLLERKENGEKIHETEYDVQFCSNVQMKRSTRLTYFRINAT